jgi:hypothetical protein
MPVEIRELQINVTVNQQNEGPGMPPAGGDPAGGKEDDKKGLIKHCIEQVLEILHNKKER